MLSWRVDRAPENDVSKPLAISPTAGWLRRSLSSVTRWLAVILLICSPVSPIGSKSIRANRSRRVSAPCRNCWMSRAATSDWMPSACEATIAPLVISRRSPRLPPAVKSGAAMFVPNSRKSFVVPRDRFASSWNWRKSAWPFCRASSNVPPRFSLMMPARPICARSMPALKSMRAFLALPRTNPPPTRRAMLRTLCPRVVVLREARSAAVPMPRIPRAA